jgi:hypothetical protein
MSWFSTKATRLVKENRIATVSKLEFAKLLGALLE